MSRHALRLSIVFALILSMTFAGSPVRGHRAGKWYGARWRTDVVGWRFDKGFPKSPGAGNAVLTGSRQWNKAGARFRFHRHRGAREAGRVNPCAKPRGRNFVQWGAIDGPGGKLAVTVSCTIASGSGPRQMHSFQMVFDSAEVWHMDRSTSPPPGAKDLWAVAAHEFGHATGRITGGPGNQGHFHEDSGQCPDIFVDARHTMCPTFNLIGAVMRTLERHDIDTFRRAYGRR